MPSYMLFEWQNTKHFVRACVITNCSNQPDIARKYIQKVKNLTMTIKSRLKDMAFSTHDISFYLKTYRFLYYSFYYLLDCKKVTIIKTANVYRNLATPNRFNI